MDPAAGLRITPQQRLEIARRLEKDRQRFQNMRRLITGKSSECPTVDELLLSESERLGVQLEISTKVDSGDEGDGK